MPSTIGTGAIAGTASAPRGQIDEYKEQLSKIKDRIHALEEKRDQAEGMERIRYEYDLQVLREMRRDLRGAKRACAATGTKKVKRISLNDAKPGAGQLADYLASQLTASLEESKNSSAEMRWMRQVLGDALVFETETNREMLSLYYRDHKTAREIGAIFHLEKTTVLRRLQRARRRIQKYAADRARLRRELMGDEIDPEQLVQDLRCYDRAPMQRQVMAMYFSGYRNYEIAIDLGRLPCSISKARKLGAEKLEVFGDDAERLRDRARYGKRALLGSWKIERYGPNHPKESIEKYDTSNPHGPGWSGKGASA